MFFNADFWEEKYQNSTIGWDIGEVSTPLKNYIDQLTNKDLQILIPGGGNSYEAEYLHRLGFKNVYVVDLSETALENIKTRVASFPSSHLIQADFFELHDLHPNLEFDLILEQTFFCAIQPQLRKDYAIQTHHLLKPNGKLVGLLFDDPLNTDKPPFGGNAGEYLTYFKPLYSLAILDSCYNSITARAGRELFIKLLKK
jgi:SAM-dependent methyltransferase